MRLNKILSVLLVCSVTSFATTTMCVKKGWKKLSEIENVALDGGVCNSIKSVNDMKSDGFRIVEIEVNPTENGIDYTYIFTDEPEEKITLPKKVMPYYNTEYHRISNVSNNQATINRGGLKIGQSGIIIHRYPNSLQSIVANGIVTDSDKDSSTIKFEKFDELEQEALPSSLKEPADKDILALNYLYANSLLIAPNGDNFRTVSKKFDKYNFIQLDIFAYYLKMNHEPLPSKKVLLDFAKKQDIGTIFISIENYVYIVDTRSFKILDKVFVFEPNIEEELPFYTRVEEIEKNFWDIDFDKILDPFGENAKKATYSSYYKNMLGIE